MGSERRLAKLDPGPPVEKEAKLAAAGKDIISSAGPELMGPLARIKNKDEGEYVRVMEMLQAHIPKAALDELDKDIKTRLGKRPKGQAEEDPEQVAKLEAKNPPRLVIDNFLLKLSSAAESTPAEMEEEAERQKTFDGPVREEVQEQEAAAQVSEDLGEKMGVDLSAVPVEQDPSVKQKLDAAGGAEGMMQGGRVFIHPDADPLGSKADQKILAEEMVHAAQQMNTDSGQGASVSSPLVMENEAKQIAEDFVAGRPVNAPVETIKPGQTAANTGAAGDTTRPVDFTFNFGGASITIDVPEGSATEIQLALSESPINGLLLQTATLTYDSDWNFQKGEVKCGVQLGSFVTASDVTLEVESSGAVACNIKGAALKIGSTFVGTIDLNLSSDGIAGTATITHEQTTLPLGLIMSGGFVRFSADQDGNLSGAGELGMELPGVGLVTLQASVINEVVAGTISVAITDARSIVGGVTLKEATLSGQYTRDAFRMTGSAKINVNDWAEADIQGSYDHPSMAYSATGIVTQTKPMQFGPMTVEDGALSVAVENNSIVSVGGGGTFTTETFTGRLGGTYDVAKQEFNGDAHAELLQEISLPGGGTLKSADGSANIIANELDELTANAVAEFPFEGQPTFEVSATECSYKVKENKFSGTGSVKTLRDLKFGSEAGFQAVIGAESSAEVKVENNEVTKIEGGVNYTVLEKGEELGGGTIELTFEGSAISGTGDFTLATDYGYPDKGAGPLFILGGSNITLHVENNEPTLLELKQVGLELRDQGTDKSGIIGATIDGSIDFTAGEVNGSINASVKSALVFDTTVATLTLKEGGTVTGTVAANELEQATIDLTLGVAVKGSKPITLDGSINGTYDAKAGEATGSIDVALVGDYGVDIGNDQVVIKDGSHATAEVTKNELEEVTIDVTLDYMREGELFLQGQIPDGKYDAKTGDVSFKGNLTLKKAIEKETANGQWKLMVLPEVTQIDVTVEKSKLTEVGGNIDMELHEGGEALLKGTLSNAVLKIDDMKFSGDLDVSVVSDYDFPRAGESDIPPGLAFTIKAGSTAKGSMTDNDLTSAEVSLDFGVKKDGTELGTGNIGGQWNVSDDKVTGTGSFTLSNDFELFGGGGNEKEPASWGLAIAANSSVSVSFTSNNLDEATIDVTIKLKKGGEEVATGSINGTYKFGDEAGFTGGITIQMSTDVELLTIDRFTIFLGQQTNVTGQTEQSKLKSATGDFVLVAKEGGEPAIDLTVNATYQEGQGISGAATITVHKPILVGSGGDYEVYLDPETGGTINVANSEPKDLSGQITISVAKGGEHFAKGTFSVQYDFSQGADAKIDAEGSVEITAALLLGEAKGYTFKLMSGTGVKFKVTQSDLDWVEGELGIEIGDAEKFAELTLNGKYVAGDAPSFSGEASAKITRKYDLGFEFKGYKFYLLESQITLTLADSEFQGANGTIGVSAEKEGGNISVELNGDYDHKSKAFNGTGTATVEGEINIGGAGGYEFVVQGGTGLSIEMSASDIKKIEGQLEGKILDSGKDFIGFSCKVTYRTEGEGEIDVDGQATLLGEKQVFKLGKYEFWLIPGEGPTATVKIEKNELKEVGGTVSFKIMDGESEPLVTGSAGGKYTDADGKFTGEGALFLGRDIKFEKAGFGIDFKKGSGGSAKVEGSELRELGGTLNCIISKGGDELVEVNASGTYDAVANNIKEANGSAKLLKPMELFGGKVILTNCEGHAELKDNELVAAGGSADVEIAAFKKVEGSVEFEWSNKSGTDEYTGSGELTIEFNDKLKGSITAELLEGGKFKVTGTVNYQLNEMIGGEIGIEMDEKFDPKLSGTLEVKDIELIPARELFNKAFDIVPAITLGPFYGINVVLGCGAGLSAMMDAVTFAGSVGFENFFPLRMNVPTFNAEFGLTGGLSFSAGVSPYVGVSGGVKGLQAGVGLEGELRLTVPIVLNPKLKLRASPEDGFSGEFLIGLSITPRLDLFVRPFVFAEIGQMMKHHLYEWTIPLGDLFTWEWSKSYPFGDKGTTPTEGGGDVAAEAPAGGTQSSTEAASGDMDGFNKGDGGGAGGGTAGGPQLGGGSSIMGGSGEGGGGGSEMEQKLAMIGEYAEKIGKVADLLGTLMDIIAIASIAGPFVQIGVIGYICYRVFIKEDLSLQILSEQLTALWSLIQEGLSFILDMLPSYIKDAYEWVTSGAENILNSMGEWLGENLQELGQAAVDFLKDAGDWGATVIEGAGEWAMEAAGWAMEALSDVGESIASGAEEAWDWATSWW